MELLVIIDKPGTPGTDPEEWFSFELKLNRELKVSIHGAMDRVRKFVPFKAEHEGWSFQINGQWNSEVAKKFFDDLDDVGNDFYKVDSTIGLRAAVKRWQSAKGGSTRYEELRPNNAPETDTLVSAGLIAYNPTPPPRDHSQINVEPVITEVS